MKRYYNNMKNWYFSLTFLSYLTTAIIGTAFGMTITLALAINSASEGQLIVSAIPPIIILVIIGVVFRVITIIFWYKEKNK
jgi:putative Ca2+/H+ antiporter (TMEM165/GDT1 family)